MVQFNRHSAEGFTSFFAADGWFVDVAAHILSGTDQILDAHRHAFAGPVKDAVCTLHDIRSRQLGPGVAYVEAPWTLTHQVSERAPEPPPPRRGLLAFTLVQNDDGWMITSGINSDYSHAFTRADSTFTGPGQSAS